VIATDVGAALGDAREGGGRLLHGRYSLVRRDDHGADHRPLRIVVKPTASGKKWVATVDGEAICVSASPFVRSARVLLEKGYPADTAIEMWRPGATEWAPRGQLGAVAATLIEGEKAPPRAKNLPPVNVPSVGDGEPPAEQTRMPKPFVEAVRDRRWTGRARGEAYGGPKRSQRNRLCSN
jgi:hypothetical protein